MFFLAFALRHSNKQSQLASWRELLERGHLDYAALTGAEKRSFGQYPEQGIHVYGNFTEHNATVPRKLARRDLAVRNSLTGLSNCSGLMTRSPNAACRRRVNRSAAAGCAESTPRIFVLMST